MKRIGYLFEKIIDKDNIRQAIKRASEGKRKEFYVKKILDNEEKYVDKLYNMLQSQEFKPNKYKSHILIDGSSGKERVVYKPKFYPDQIVHWCIMLVLEPIFMKSMYDYTCASIPNRGIKYGATYLRKELRNNNYQYCLKLDIKKFFPSINQNILKNKFRKKIKDDKVLYLLDLIVNSHDKGLPIGNYTSQWFSNFYLEELDHYIKEQLHCKVYIRYMDDIVILDNSKTYLHKILKNIKEFLEKDDLKIKNDWQIFKINKRAIDFLGYKFYNNSVHLRRRNYLRIIKRINKIQKKDCINVYDARCLISYNGLVKFSNCYKFKQLAFYNLIQVAKLVISKNKPIERSLCYG